jgi:hypothetical protein
MQDRGTKSGRPKRRRIFVGLLAVLLCFWIGWTAISWVLGRQAVERYCTGLAPGATIEQARDEARAEGLRFPARLAVVPAGEGVVFVTSFAVFGRYVCEVRHDGKKVTGAALQFVD